MNTDNHKKFGRYTLLRLLARGGMGEVYLAVLSGVAGFEKKCIIKKIREDLSSDPLFVERFLNEGRTLVALTHSNIVQIFDMGVVDGKYFLAMEYIQGDDLRNLLKLDVNKTIPVNIAIYITKEVLKGLGYAHRATDNNGRPLMIVHRDISPSNILISEQGEVKIIDFGIAKARTIETISGIVQGKFAYMSPEQARGDSLDCRTDIFSMGIVLYEMLSGKRPFEGESDLQLLERIKTAEYPSLCKENPDIDSDLDEIVRKSLDKNLDNRYQNAEEFYDALDGYAKSHQCLSEQRDIIAYFGPLMETIGPVLSVDDAIGAALDEMILAQNGEEGTLTKTVSPVKQGSDSNNWRIMTQSGKRRVIDRSAFENVDVEAGTEDMPIITEDEIDQLEIAQKQESVISKNLQTPVVNASAVNDVQNLQTNPELSPEEDSQSQNNETTDLAGSKKQRRTHKFRYMILGALIAVLAGIIGFIVFWQIDSPEKARELHSAIKEVYVSKNDSSNTDWMNSQIAADLMNKTSGGLPLHIKTDPDYSTIYIVEGAYRALDNKNVVLLPEVDAVIAIQAPGYETCLFNVYLDGQSPSGMRHTDWQNCRSVSTRISQDATHVEVAISLSPIVPGMKRDTDTIIVQNPSPEPSNNSIQPVDDAPQNDTQIALNSPSSEDNSTIENTQNPKAQNSKESVPKTDNDSRPNTEKKSDPRVKDNNRENKEDKSAKASQSNASKASVSIKSNVSAQARYHEDHCALPCTLQGPSGDRFQVVPEVSGRRIAVPYSSAFGREENANIEFCEATVRIRESYAEGDSAPYQIADIAIDGVVYAKQTDVAVMVMPCGKHKLSAEIHAQGAVLSASESIDLTAGKNYTTSLQLK